MRKFRAYFNRKREAPQVWSVDEGTQATEINVLNWVASECCRVESRYNGEKVNEDTPSAFVEITAIGFHVSHGICYFVGECRADSQLP